ncbi:type II toxin-antitoxin system VapC family toxin [Candidatus Pacearchaeota archaeon]|nr:type II toxin-antitoxin system VapC family toxin [Candidatus Pacearchaeota archaeon]
MDRKICLDTNIIIDFLRKNPKTKRIIDNLGEEFYTTQIITFEVWSGRLKHEENMIKDMLGSLIKIDFNENSALKAGDIQMKLKETGDLIDFRDLFIASICIVNDLELLTNNKKHFEKLKKFGLKLI